MTEKEANNILQEKYPQGYIRYSDIGRKANTNRVILVSFTEHGKDYQYKGSYDDVLIRLGCMEAPPAIERTYKLENNMFINAIKNNNTMKTQINTMKKLIKIKHYPSNFEVAYEEKNETIVHSLSYDGLKGVLTRKEWEKDCFIADFDEIDQEKILDYMNIFEIFADEEELSLREIADIEGLRYVETTSGTNGYPQNIQGAIIGFDDWEQLEKIAIKYNLEAINLHRRDGWQLYERNGIATEPLKNSSNDYGDDYFEYDDAEAYQKQTIEDILPYAVFPTFEDIENWVKEKKEVYEEILSCGEDKTVITYQGRFYEKISKTSMSFSHDTHNYIIGLER